MPDQPDQPSLDPLTLAQADAAYALLCTLTANVQILGLPPCLLEELVASFVYTLQSVPQNADKPVVSALVEATEEIGTRSALHGLFIGMLIQQQQRQQDAQRPHKRLSNNPKDYDLRGLNKLMTEGDPNA